MKEDTADAEMPCAATETRGTHGETPDAERFPAARKAIAFEPTLGKDNKLPLQGLLTVVLRLNRKRCRQFPHFSRAPLLPFRNHAKPRPLSAQPESLNTVLAQPSTQIVNPTRPGSKRSKPMNKREMTFVRALILESDRIHRSRSVQAGNS